MQRIIVAVISRACIVVALPMFVLGSGMLVFAIGWESFKTRMARAINYEGSLEALNSRIETQAKMIRQQTEDNLRLLNILGRVVEVYDSFREYAERKGYMDSATLSDFQKQYDACIQDARQRVKGYRDANEQQNDK